MAIYRTSDHLTKCDPGMYSNIYDVRKRSDIKNPVSQAPSFSKDTIEISKDKIKEEALSRLRHTTKVVVDQTGFMRIGKFLFVTVTFPPYLLLYGLPKWVLVEAVPYVLTIISNIWNKVAEKAKEQIEQKKNVVVRMFIYVQKITQVLIQPIIRLSFELKQKMIDLFNKGTQLMSKAGELLTLPGKKVKEGVETIRNSVVKLKEKIVEQAKNAAEKLQEGIQWISQKPLAIVYWGQLQFQKIAAQAGAKTSRVSQKMQTTQKNAHRAAEWVANQVVKGTDQIKKLFAPLLAFVQEKGFPLCRRIGDALKGKWKQGADFFQKRQQKSLSFLARKQGQLKKLSVQYLLNHLSPNSWLSAKILKWLSNPVFRAICEAVIGFYKLTASIALSGLFFTLRGVSKGGRILTSFFDKAKSFSEVFIINSSKLLSGSFALFRKTSFKTLYFTILYTMMMGILLGWGFRSLGNIMKKFNLKTRLSS